MPHSSHCGDEFTALRLRFERQRSLAERRWVHRHYLRLQLLASIRDALTCRQPRLLKK